MMNPDKVVALPYKFIRHSVYGCLIQKIGIEAEIDTVETDSFVRSVFKSQFSIFSCLDKTVFPCGSVLKK